MWNERNIYYVKINYIFEEFILILRWIIVNNKNANVINILMYSKGFIIKSLKNGYLYFLKFCLRVFSDRLKILLANFNNCMHNI